MSGLILPGGVNVDTSEAEMKILGAAKAMQFMIPLGLNMQVPSEQTAFLRLRDLDMIRLFDIVGMPLPNGQTVAARLFVMTTKGQARLNEIIEKRKLDKRLGT